MSRSVVFSSSIIPFHVLLVPKNRALVFSTENHPCPLKTKHYDKHIRYLFFKKLYMILRVQIDFYYK